MTADTIVGVAKLGGSGSRSTATFREVLAIREFRALYVAQTLSVMGDQLARIAVAVLIFTRTGSTALTGISYAVSYLPWLLGGPTLSVLADRLPRRSVMVVCDIARAITIGLVAIKPPLSSLLIASVALVALIEPPFASARAALVPDVVGSSASYTAAATLGNMTSQLAVVVGFAVGGALTSVVGPRPTLALDALTFASSAFIVAVAVSIRPPALVAHASWLRQMRDGASLVFRDAQLRWLATTSWVVVGAVIASEAIAVPYAHAHGGGSVAAGFLTASLPAGVTAGALILGRVVDQDRVERLLPLLAVLAPLTLAVTGFNPAPTLVALIWFISGGLSAMSVVANRLFVVAVPTDIRGRAFGIAAAGISTAQGLGSLLVGVIARQFGPAQAVEMIALPACALTLLLTLQWSLQVRPARINALKTPH